MESAQHGTGNDSTFRDVRATVGQVLSTGLLFADFAESVLRAIPVGAQIFAEEGVQGLASDRVPPELRRLLAWSLLRYLGARGRFASEPAAVRPRLIQLIEVELGRELAEFDVDFREQSFVVEQQLAQVVPSIERDVREAIQFRSLDNISALRNEVLKTLNSKRNSGLLLTFVDRPTVRQSIPTALEAIDSFCSADDSDVLEAYQDAVNACHDCIRELDDTASSYAGELADCLIKPALLALDERLTNLQVAEPAQLAVALESKRYPLHEAGLHLLIRVRVSNQGAGNAFGCHVAIDGTGELGIRSPELNVGNLPAGESRVLQVEATVVSPERIALLHVVAHWVNFDRSPATSPADLELEGQDPNIDWDELELRAPYALNIAIGEEFVGREQLLGRLRSLVTRVNPGSAYLWGQKRVGKTSVAKALATELEANAATSVAYLETIREVSAEDTINGMCRRLIQTLQTTHPSLQALVPSDPTGTLAPLSAFLEDAQRVVPDQRFILILDEFDELPMELYRARAVADTFFQTLGKGIAGKENTGVLIVGGERIPAVIRDQGMRLNMYRPERIDHFDRDKEWASFVELVTRPGAPLEFTPDALDVLWHFSAGNPYFLKEIAGRVAAMMIERRDAHITADEATEGVRRTLDEIEANSFAHYWDDGLIALEDAEFRERRSERVRFLLAAADSLRDTDTFSRDHVVRHGITYRCSEQDIDRQLNDFRNRGIIQAADGAFRFRVPLFQQWLSERGYLDLSAIVAGELELAQKVDRERSLAVSGTEIRDLVEKWGPYQNRKLTESDVRDWLNQFGAVADQRLMFRLLQSVRFYSGDVISAKYEQTHRSVVASVGTRIEPGRPQRRDILVSYLGSAGSSGPSMARMYRQANGIYRDNCVEPDAIEARLREDAGIAAVVLVDDFVGTGRTAIRLLRELCNRHTDLRALLEERGVGIWFAVVAGIDSGLGAVERELERTLGDGARLICADELSSTDRAFDEGSSIWEADEDRVAAEEVARSFGERLEKRAPLGFGNAQALVVFEDNCPNNTLPILYRTRTGMEGFRPLFPRS